MCTKKIIISIIIILLLSSVVLVPKTFAIAETIDEGDGFLNAGKSEDEVIDTGKIKKVSSKIYNILLGCAIGVAVIVGAALGITFILSSAEGKAKVSETLVPYIIGCCVAFGAFAIWNAAIRIGNGIHDTSASDPVKQAQADIQDVIDGKVDLTKQTDAQLKYLYRAAIIDQDLNTFVNDKRNLNKITVEEAVKNLSPHRKKIYDECKKRRLLKDDGIWLK